MCRHDVRTAVLTCFAALLLSAATALHAQKFYPDDPLTAEPPPEAVVDPEPRQLSGALELVNATLGHPGEWQPADGVIGALGINTLGEVLDGPWFVNRHARKRMTPHELVRGPGNDHAPAADGPLRVLSLRPFTMRPGMLVADRANRMYLLRFDPRGYPETATGAEMVSSRLLYAAGYHVAEAYLLTVDRDRLLVTDGSEITSSAGRTRSLRPDEIDRFLKQMAPAADGRFRAVALYIDEEWQELLGPYQMFGTRSDDPNDIVPHEHRREQRGLFVLCAWINHSSMRAQHTQDALVVSNGVPHLRHYLTDLRPTLGSGYREPKRVQEGNDPMFDRHSVLENIVGLGVWAPAWMRAKYPHLRGVGHVEAATFDPERWVTVERLAPFENRLPDDEYWGARIVLSFTDADISAVVGAGAYSDPEASAWIARVLRERRDRIGRTYLDKVLPLDDFGIVNGALQYEDLAQKYGFREGQRQVTVRWARLDNDSGQLTDLEQSNPAPAVPDAVNRAEPGTYFAAILTADDPSKTVTVYVRTGAPLEIVGLERSWPGKQLVPGRPEPGNDVQRFASLLPEQQRLYAPFAQSDMAAAGRSMTVEQHFDSEPVAERTTYEAVTHAAIRSRLTDADGNDLGRAFDLIARVDRIHGQYAGRSGDQQFRIYVDLKPGAVDILERSTQFFRDEENTVYHVGYPMSFRQTGKDPTMQFSVSEDGLRADIDVDYRSSKAPKSLFNGHLTAANSDIRAGDNLERHNGRWSGLIAWWREVLGRLTDRREAADDTTSLALGRSLKSPTATPPDRPRGTVIPDVSDTVQEFLSDWLVRRKIDEALDRVSTRAAACLNIDDDAASERLESDAARRELRNLMRYSSDQLGRRATLAGAVDAVQPSRQDLTVVSHPYQSDFALLEMTASQAAPFLCGSAAGLENKAFYGVLFRFKRAGAGVLGLLWAREADEWRVVAYRVFEI
jgi:hypothetical protein